MYNWLKQLWTVDNMNLSEWIKEGLLPVGHYTKGMSWKEIMMYSPNNKRMGP